MSVIDFRPKYMAYYPGPYSPARYNVVIAYFHDDDSETAIDAAIELQYYYGGVRDQQEFKDEIIYGANLKDHLIRPVSIYNCSRELEKEGFIRRFADKFFYVDEILIIGSDRGSEYKDYLIAACELFKFPVFYLEKKDAYFIKTEVSPAKRDLLSVFTSELMQDSDLDKVEKIEISSYDSPCFFGVATDPQTHIDSSREIKLDFIFPNVPLKISRRFDEWYYVWEIYLDDTGSDFMVYRQELEFLVGAFNYYLKGRFTVLTPDDSEGTPFYSDEDYLSEELDSEQIKHLKKEVLGNRNLKEYFGKIGDSYLVSLENNEIIRILKDGSLQILSSEALAMHHPLFKGKKLPEKEMFFIQQALEKGEFLNLDEYYLKRRNTHMFTKFNTPKYKEDI